MKLRKINDIHFVITDGNPTTNGDYAIHSITLNVSQHHSKDNSLSEGWEKIKFSTQPLEGVELLSLSEVKELLREVDVEMLGYNRAVERKWHPNSLETRRVAHEIIEAVKFGYNQAIEDNKEKKYTEEDIREVVRLSLEDAETSVIWSREWYSQILADRILQSLQPKTEWEVEIVNDKVKLI